MRRNLLVVAIGITFLILMTWIGAVLVDIIPHRPTAQLQTAQAGPYAITMQVNPNPPLITQPATLSVHILIASSQQPVTNAHVTLESNMESMDMGTDHADAHAQNDGSYLAHVQFGMSGLWQVRVSISVPGKQLVSVAFEITAQ